MNERLPPVIAIDGPSGSGKGTVASRVAETLGWHLLDSGALYRLLAHAASLAGIPVNQPGKLGQLAKDMQVAFILGADGNEHILLDDHEVTSVVRSEECGNRASELAVIPEVREGLQRQQRKFRQFPGLVADGRDMGTIIFPDAGLKIFLTASAEERAKRRYNQLKQKGLNANLRALFGDIAARDQRDQGRSVSPLKPAADAVVLDTTGIGIGQVVAEILDLARKRLGQKPMRT